MTRIQEIAEESVNRGRGGYRPQEVIDLIIQAATQLIDESTVYVAVSPPKPERLTFSRKIDMSRVGGMRP